MTKDEYMKSFYEFLPVVYDGIEYAYVWGVALIHDVKGRPSLNLQLMDKNNNSLENASPSKVELVK